MKNRSKNKGKILYCILFNTIILSLSNVTISDAIANNNIDDNRGVFDRFFGFFGFGNENKQATQEENKQNKEQQKEKSNKHISEQVDNSTNSKKQTKIDNVSKSNSNVLNTQQVNSNNIIVNNSSINNNINSNINSKLDKLIYTTNKTLNNNLYKIVENNLNNKNSFWTNLKTNKLNNNSSNNTKFDSNITFGTIGYNVNYGYFTNNISLTFGLTNSKLEDSNNLKFKTYDVILTLYTKYYISNNLYTSGFISYNYNKLKNNTNKIINYNDNNNFILKTAIGYDVYKYSYIKLINKIDFEYYKNDIHTNFEISPSIALTTIKTIYNILPTTYIKYNKSINYKDIVIDNNIEKLNKDNIECGLELKTVLITDLDLSLDYNFNSDKLTNLGINVNYKF